MYLYRGEQYDPDLGLYYLRARYFNPLTGRFLTTDPAAGRTPNPASFHKYAYANGDPVNWIDPSGRAGLLTFDPANAGGYLAFSPGTLMFSTDLKYRSCVATWAMWGGVGGAVAGGAAGGVGVIWWGGPILAGGAAATGAGLGAMGGMGLGGLLGSIYCAGDQAKPDAIDIPIPKAKPRDRNPDKCDQRRGREEARCAREYRNYPNLLFKCLDRAFWRWSNCRRNMPDPGPLDPLDPNWSLH